MSSADHAKNLASVMRTLKNKYRIEEPPAARSDPMEEFVFSYLLWESNTSRAENALKRIVDSVVDFNELRVCRPYEIATMMGKTYPRVDERAQRLKASIQDIYQREYEVSLTKAMGMNKRDGRAYIDSLEGIPEFVAARVALMVLGAHAIPVDEQLLALLIEHEIVEAGDDLKKAGGILERHIKSADGPLAHALLQAWSDDKGAAAAARLAASNVRPVAAASDTKRGSATGTPSPERTRGRTSSKSRPAARK